MAADTRQLPALAKPLGPDTRTIPVPPGFEVVSLTHPIPGDVNTNIAFWLTAAFERGGLLRHCLFSRAVLRHVPCCHFMFAERVPQLLWLLPPALRRNHEDTEPAVFGSQKKTALNRVFAALPYTQATRSLLSELHVAARLDARLDAKLCADKLLHLHSLTFPFDFPS